MLQYLRSNTFGLGKVGCWVDDNKSVLTILDGQWGKSTPCTISCIILGQRLITGCRHSTQPRIVSPAR